MSKNGAKNTITVAMLMLGAVALTAVPDWFRGIRDFITSKAGGKTSTTQTTGGGGGATLQP